MGLEAARQDALCRSVVHVSPATGLSECGGASIVALLEKKV